MKLQKYMTENGEYPSTSDNWIPVFPASHHLLTTGTSKTSQLGRDHPKWPLPRHSVLVQPPPVMNRTHIHPPLSCAFTQAWFAECSMAAAPEALLCCRRKTCTGGVSRDRSNSALKSYSQGYGRGKDHHQNQTSIIQRQIIQFVV